MLHKARGIVLHTIKYSDSRIIAYIYTDLYGRQSYVISGSHSRKSANKINLLQPLSLLEIEVDYKPKRNLQTTKELFPAYIFHSIPYHIAKSTVSIFLAEVLYKTLKEEESNETLFDFIFNSIQLFDINTNEYANFHLVFLILLSKHLGFFPMNNYSKENKYFDITNGKFVPVEYSKSKCFRVEISIIFSKLLGLTYQNMQELHIDSQLRYNLLENITKFYSVHIEKMGKINSLEVLKEIFHY